MFHANQQIVMVIIIDVVLMATDLIVLTFGLMETAEVVVFPVHLVAIAVLVTVY